MSGALAVLARIRANRPTDSSYERCEMCATPLGDAHGHVVDVARHALMCACRPCYLLFAHDSPSLGRRAVPERFLALPVQPPQVWDALELPVGTAFLFVSSAAQRVVALYPGPAGATESELPLAAWDGVLQAIPALASIQPDVEAVLVHSGDDGVAAFLVPIDTCYELVGHLRQLWRGFDGGQDVHRRLESFFAEIRAQSAAG